MAKFAPTMNTYQMLFIRYMSPVISLETVVKDYLVHMSIEHAKRLGSRQELPFPVARLGEKGKASWVVNLSDLAVYIDKQTAIAQQDHKAMHNN
ncbi:pyocin activator PrtN family protein [Acinetobacter sp. ANC 3832]|uniref:pyocin activator PrtN family protein n=1 Tax=Acinetobacter sp. ANC 3832 TaxID=1977874 RepID=UPI000A347A74|nr:pyocin activator PrtN family protein [Acinetobacter sp. ANC 3832]OTG94245.1 hypothetical protein B9T35_07510 [Acinetobacter sp. ANC 3832]